MGVPGLPPAGRRSYRRLDFREGVSGFPWASHPPCLLAVLPPPTLSVNRESAEVLRPGEGVTLVCQALLSGVDFQLRRGEEVLLVPRSSTSPDRIFFHLNALALGDSGLYTCRYRLRDERTPWSADSAPVELLLSDGEPGAAPWAAGETPKEGPRDCTAVNQGLVPTHVPQFPQLRMGR